MLYWEWIKNGVFKTGIAYWKPFNFILCNFTFIYLLNICWVLCASNWAVCCGWYRDVWESLLPSKLPWGQLLSQLFHLIYKRLYYVYSCCCLWNATKLDSKIYLISGLKRISLQFAIGLNFKCTKMVVEWLTHRKCSKLVPLKKT